MIIFLIMAYFSIFECKSNSLYESQISSLDPILRKNNYGKLEPFLSITSRNNYLAKSDSPSFKNLDSRNEFLGSNIRIPNKRTIQTKKFRALTHNGYSLDMNVENFKSLVIFYFNNKLTKLFIF